jgi:lauroyl/myristoyl acyltransferase
LSFQENFAHVIKNPRYKRGFVIYYLPDFFGGAFGAVFSAFFGAAFFATSVSL